MSAVTWYLGGGVFVLVCRDCYAAVGGGWFSQEEALSSLDCLEAQWSSQTQPAKCWDSNQEPPN